MLRRRKEMLEMTVFPGSNNKGGLEVRLRET